MFIKYSNVKNLQTNSYTAVKQSHLVDLIDNKEIRKYVQYLNFEKSTLYVYSQNEVSVRISLTGLELPDSILEMFDGLSRYLFYKLESLKYDLVLRINAFGELLYIENKNEILEKWQELKRDVLDKGRDSLIDNLVIQGGTLFDLENFVYETLLKKDSFFIALFPVVFNQDLLDDTMLRKIDLSSVALLDSNMMIPIEVWYENIGLKKNEFEVNHIYNIEDEAIILDSYNSFKSKKYELLSYVYQHFSKYKFDKNDCLEEVEYQQIENINGEMDVVEYIKISKK